MYPSPQMRKHNVETQACSATEKNEIKAFAKKEDLEIILLSKISQTQKDKCHVFSQMWNLDHIYVRDIHVCHIHVIIYIHIYNYIHLYHIHTMIQKSRIVAQGRNEANESRKPQRVQRERKKRNNVFSSMEPEDKLSGNKETELEE